MLIYDRFDPQVFCDALAVELKDELNIQEASERVIANLDKDILFYEKIKQKQLSNPYSLLNISDGKMFLKKLSKSAAGHKYIKKIPNPKGKGFIYFYNKEQIKDFKEKGTIPGEEKEDKKEPKKEEKTESQKEQQKAFIKSVIKKVISGITEALSGKGTMPLAGQAVEEAGEGIESKSKKQKTVPKKTVPKKTIPKKTIPKTEENKKKTEEVEK